MKKYLTFLLRLALGAGFLSAVADRLGYWGKPGDVAVAWGNWEHFIQYTGTLSFGVTGSVANVLGLAATIAELVLGILLIVGFKIRYTSFCAGILLLIFALAMSFNTHVKYALDYSVFVAGFSALLLATTPESKWSIDNVTRR